MTINSVAELYSYTGYTKSVSDTTALKRISEISTPANSNIIEKVVSQEDKSPAVANSDNSAVIYDFRFLPHVPLANTSETGKTFNETEKTNKKENDKKSFASYMNNDETEAAAAPQQDSTGKGYYIVLSNTTPPPEKKTSFSPKELLQERINNTYHLTRMRRNGALVNLTF